MDGRGLCLVIIPVQSSDIPVIWPKVEGLVKHALNVTANGRFLPEDILNGLRAARMQLWLVGKEGLKHAEALVITEITRYPQKRYCTVTLVAGAQREHWIDHLDTIEAWAMENNCDGMEAIGRRGWTKEPKLKDWKWRAVVMEKDL